MEGMPEPVIQFENVSFAYGDRPVLENVDLTVRRGEFLALVGPNGGGKSTLVKLALGLLEPTTGRVRVLGGPPEHAAGRMGYVPQRSEQHGGFPVTVLDTVVMGLDRSSRGLFSNAKARREAGMAALGRVDLTDQAGRRFHRLSGGQQQRVLIARALASRAEILILDEPTANVDPSGSFCFFDFLCSLGESEKLTILSVSHDLTIMASHITSMACVNHRLVYNPAPTLTEEMMTMLYGAHEHSCAMDGHIRQLTKLLAEERTNV